MSDHSERRPDEGEPAAPLPPPSTTPDISANGSALPEDPTERLKREAAANRLSPELKAEILAELPPPEERERELRQPIENGGLSSEEFFASLGL